MFAAAFTWQLAPIVLAFVVAAVAAETGRREK